MSKSNQIDLKKPRALKAVVQIGIGSLITSHLENKQKIIDDASYVISMITGQKGKIIQAKKSVAGFKLRKGDPVAILVTLRKKKLNYFIQRLVTYVLPKMKDFYGLKNNNFDSKGNINFGFKEATIFPEAISDKIKYQFGLEINIVGSGKRKEDNLKLWSELGFPLKI